MVVELKLLGGFEVVRDGEVVPPEAWSRRQACQLVQVLALARDRTLHREQIAEVLWPDVPWDLAAPRLHKAAHYARRALQEPEGVVLRNELVSLFPRRTDVVVDVDQLTRTGGEAVRRHDKTLADEALRWYGGPLLPEEPYAPWATRPRETARLLYLDLLRLLGRWEEVLREEPADEPAHLSLVRDRMARGDHRGALARLERLEQALRHELGAAPGPEAVAVRAELELAAAQARPRPSPAASPVDARAASARLFGRREAGDRIREVLRRAGEGQGATVLVTGPAGVGKSAVLDLADTLAKRAGWKVGRGGASSVEGPWPYAPVLEALSSVCRRHPALLDALGDDFRAEIERALAGRDLDWTGESSHQRLFVAAAELMRVAAAGPGVLLVVDDVHDADEASLRLLHYLSRCALGERAVLLLAYRDPAPERIREVAAGMLAHGGGQLLELGPLSPTAAHRLLADRHPELRDDELDEIVAAGAGLPFPMLEMARSRSTGAPTAAAVLPRPALRTFQHVALLGLLFSTDEVLALAEGSVDTGYEHLEIAIAAFVVEPVEGGFRFRHPLLRESLLGQLSAHRRSQAHLRVAEALAGLGRPPGRVAHHYLAAGLPSRAVPYVVRAVETAGALGAYRDALALVDGVRDHAGRDDLGTLLARRGDLLMALGDPQAVQAYTEAARVTTGMTNRLVRARLARAAAIAGDFTTGASALQGLDLEDDEADASILLAKGHLAYLTGDMATAREVAEEARGRLRGLDDPWHLVDLIGLQGLLAHQRGEWFANFRVELRRTQGLDRLAGALFDAHLCVAETLLYGREPYEEIIAESEQLRLRASQAGALRGVAFATALIGEAALMMGDLPRAEAELVEAVELHRDTDSTGGQAHAMQRLAEVRLAQGRPSEAGQLLDEALVLARWSTMAPHLLQRIYGTLISAAPDPESARFLVDRAASTLGHTERCQFCAVMLAVPAAVACAQVGDLEEARLLLDTATRSVALWGETSWRAAVVEAAATVAMAEGDAERAGRLAREAADAYTSVGQPQDAARVLASAYAG